MDEKLATIQGTSKVRKDILNIAKDSLEKVSRTAENATMVDRSIGVAIQRLGALYERVGDTEEAIRLTKLSVEIFDRLETRDPEDDWLRWNKAVAFDILAGLSRDYSGDSAAAMEYPSRPCHCDRRSSLILVVPCPLSPASPSTYSSCRT